eukprot:g7281.t1
MRAPLALVLLLQQLANLAAVDAVPVRFSDLPAGLIDRGLTDAEFLGLATTSRGVRSNQVGPARLANWKEEVEFQRRAARRERVRGVVEMFNQNQLTWDDYFRSNTEATAIGGNGQSRHSNMLRELLHDSSIIQAALRTLERNADPGSEGSWDNVVPLETRQNIGQLTYDAQRELVLWGLHRGLLHWRDYFDRRTDADGNQRIPDFIAENESQVQQLAQDMKDCGW